MNQQTYSRPLPPPSVDEVSKSVSQQLAGLDPVRGKAAADLQGVRAGRAATYFREQERLTIKFGPEHPRVIALADKIRFNDGLQRDLKFEAARSRIEVPIVEKGTFIFHGHVRSCSGKLMPGLTIALSDSQGNWLRGFGYGCSDADGYFTMQGAADVAVSPATIRVYGEQKLLITDATPLPIAPGKIEYRFITVCDDGSCPPPPDQTDPAPPAPLTVPDVLGTTEAAATAELAKAGFTVKSNPRGGASKEIGLVLAQTPAGNSLAARGSVVELSVGVAEPAIAVPDVVSQTLRDARTILENAGLTVGKIDPPDAPVLNKVTKQSPPPATEIQHGAAVDLVIEIPVETVPVPKVVKLSLGEAKKAIAASGLTLGKTNPFAPSDQSIVLEQNPVPQTLVKPGSPVDLELQKENNNQTSVPLLIDKPLVEAKRILDAARLKLGKLKPDDATDKHIVTAQSPKAESRVPEATGVDLEFRPPGPKAASKTALKKKRPKKSRKKRSN